MSYVDGFVIAVPTAHRETYKKLAEMAAAVFKEHGALKVVECWGDDVPDGKVTSFPMAVKAQGGRDGRLLLDRLAVARGARCRQQEGHGGPAHEARQPAHALRRQAHDLRRLRGAARALRHSVRAAILAYAPGCLSQPGGSQGGHSRKCLCGSLRALEDRPEDGAQPLLPGAALQRHGPHLCRAPWPRMRGIKAEGGWAVVCTEQCDIHWTSEITPYARSGSGTTRDIPYLARMVDEVHRYDALAAIELVAQGLLRPQPATAASRRCRASGHGAGAVLSRARRARWTRTTSATCGAGIARRRCARKRAGFDIVYVYAGHNLCAGHAFPRRAATTSAPTSTAARSRTARACCAS